MQVPRITDICLITRDLEAGVDFYTKKLGFQVSSRMPGFVDFVGNGIVLALWDAQRLITTTGVPGQVDEPSGRGVMLAIELESPAAIDQMHASLSAQGVELYGEPKDYPWNARCIYFPGPSGEFWEYFAWLDGGKPGVITP